MESTEQNISHFLPWDEAAPDHPFRASIGRNAYYDVGRPPPHLAAASKRCRGGRILSAFRIRELRDYFVAGHMYQGAQAEPDGAEHASPQQKIPASPDTPTDFNDALAFLNSAIEIEAKVDKEIQRVFNDAIDRLLAKGHHQDATNLAFAMPPCGAQKTLAFHAIQKSGSQSQSQPLHLTAPLFSLYTAEQATVMTEWIRSFDKRDTADKALDIIVLPKARRIFKEEGSDALTALLKRLPKACSAWFTVYGLRQL